MLLVGQIAYWVVTALGILALIHRNTRGATRVVSWRPPSSLTDHRGEALPKEALFFGRPTDEDGLLRSAETTLQGPVRRLAALAEALYGAMIGACWGALGLWLSPISPIGINYCVVATCAIVSGWDSFQRWRAECMTYVGTDSFGFVGGQTSRSGNLLWTRTLRVLKCPFADIEGGVPGDTELILHKKDGAIVSVRCPVGLLLGDWKRWLNAVIEAFEEARWSRSLQHLGFWNSRSSGVRDLPDRHRLLLTAVMFDVISVLGNRSLHGPDVIRCPNGRLVLVRLPTGRLGFAEDGLVFENWMPLYGALGHSRLTAEGVQLARQAVDSQLDTTDVGHIIETWRNNHVQYFPAAAIASIEETTDCFTIRTHDGRAFEFNCTQVVGYDTLLRLMRSSIWSDGIVEELRRQLAQDLTQLQQSPDGTPPTGSGLIFGRRLPQHRALVWDAALRLQVSDSQAQECAGELMRAAFQDSQRVLAHRRLYWNQLRDYWLRCARDDDVPTDEAAADLIAGRDPPGDGPENAPRHEL